MSVTRVKVEEWPYSTCQIFAFWRQHADTTKWTQDEVHFTRKPFVGILAAWTFPSIIRKIKKDECDEIKDWGVWPTLRLELAVPSGYMPLITPAVVCTHRRNGDTRMRVTRNPSLLSFFPFSCACKWPFSVSGGSHGRAASATQVGSASSIRSPCRITNRFCTPPFEAEFSITNQSSTHNDSLPFQSSAPLQLPPTNFFVMVWHNMRRDDLLQIAGSALKESGKDRLAL